MGSEDEEGDWQTWVLHDWTQWMYSGVMSPDDAAAREAMPARSKIMLAMAIRWWCGCIDDHVGNDIIVVGRGCVQRKGFWICVDDGSISGPRIHRVSRKNLV